MNEDQILVARIDITEAKRLRNILEPKGVRLELIANPETCNSCGPNGAQVEIYVAEDHVAAFKDLVATERAKLLDGLPAGAAGDGVIDLDQATANCPACGTSFSTTAAECPDCGLGFSGPLSADSE